MRLRHDWRNSQLGLQQRRWPCFSTYTYAAAANWMPKAEDIIAHLLRRAQTSRRCGEEPSRLLLQSEREQSKHVYLDGKALRGTYGHEATHQPVVHLLSFSEVATGTMLAQREVQTKENEISAVKAMLTPTLVKGRLLSADAMHTQRFFCRRVTSYPT